MLLATEDPEGFTSLPSAAHRTYNHFLPHLRLWSGSTHRYHMSFPIPRYERLLC